MSALAAIHVGKKQLGLEDDDYRALLGRITGKRSAGALNEAERSKVLEEMRRLGFKPQSKGSRGTLEGRYAKKLVALWISAWELGIVRNRSDKALIAFVKRQTGMDHVRFVHDPADAARAIEALKSWMAREGGVEWPTKSETAEIARNNPGFDAALHDRHCVVWALGKKLRDAGVIDDHLLYLRRVFGGGLNHWVWTAEQLDQGIRILGGKLRKAKG